LDKERRKKKKKKKFKQKFKWKFEWKKKKRKKKTKTKRKKSWGMTNPPVELGERSLAEPAVEGILVGNPCGLD